MNKEEDRFSVGLYIRQQRLTKRMTTEKLANAVGVSKSTISKWENGYIKNMGIDKALKLSKILEIDPINIIESPLYSSTDKEIHQISPKEAVKEIFELLDNCDMTEEQKNMIKATTKFVVEKGGEK